jgi:hypothetical protein
MASVGGAAAAGFVGPIIGKYLPASLGASPVGRIIGAAAVGAVGYMALKRVNRNAALAFAAAAIAPEVTGALGRTVAGVNGFDGYGEPDGVNYLPYGVDGFDDGEDLDGFDDGEDLEGLGELDEDYADVS